MSARHYSFTHTLNRIVYDLVMGAHMSHGHSSASPATTSAARQVDYTVAVGAGKGGVGKSTAAALLAIGLARRGLRVGLLDADVYGPSIPTLMGVAGSRPEAIGEPPRMLPIEAKGVKVMSIGFMLDPEQAVIWRGPMIHGVIKQFLEQVDWGPLDYMIIDLPPGTGDVPLTLAQSVPITGSVVVCTPQDIALQDARRAVQMYRALNVPSLGIIENMSYFLCPKCGHREEIFASGGAQEAAAALEIPFLGAIPLNTSIRQFCDAGTPERAFMPAESGPHVSAALDVIVGNLIAQVEAAAAENPAMPTLSVE
jgi:ATP-binding protein involved in chromosome partitioning